MVGFDFDRRSTLSESGTGNVNGRSLQDFRRMAVQEIVAQFMPNGKALKSLAGYRSRVEDPHIFAGKYYASADTVHIGRFRLNMDFRFFSNLKWIDGECREAKFRSFLLATPPRPI